VFVAKLVEYTPDAYLSTAIFTATAFVHFAQQEKIYFVFTFTGIILSVNVVGVQ